MSLTTLLPPLSPFQTQKLIPSINGLAGNPILSGEFIKFGPLKNLTPLLKSQNQNHRTATSRHRNRAMADDSQTSAVTGADQTVDPTTQRKHAAMIARLTNLHQSRLSTKPTTTDSDSSDPPPSFESTQSFLSLFSTSKQSIESQLTIINNQSLPNPNSKSDLDNVSLSISHLEKLLADNSYFLPSYEVRTCLKTIQDLKQTVDSVTAEVIPKKKFSFKNKSTKKAESNVGSFVPGNNVSETNFADSEKGKLHSRVYESPGFRGKQNEVLEKEFGGDLEGEGVGEFSLTDLSNCEVRLKGCLRALFMNRLKNCKVYVGPVFGSVLIEEAEECVFVLASHQIRIHHAKQSDFYLRVRSRPIIEDCGSVRFAPYCLSYDGIERDLKESNLEEETGSWASVDDFRWLRAVQSPNWSILPESERIDAVNI